MQQPENKNNQPIGADSAAQAYSYIPAGRKKPDLDHEDEASQERWLLSYADFITLLMVLFMMLYALQLVKVEDINANNARSTASPRDASPQTAISTQENLWLEELAPLVDQGLVRWMRDKRGLEININAGTLFSSAEAKLLPQSKPVLIQIAKVLRHWENNLILVEGHTDSQPISTDKFESNWELSSARAGSVVRYFVDQGLAPNRLTAMGRADNVPASLGDTAADRAKNRRVTIRVPY